MTRNEHAQTPEQIRAEAERQLDELTRSHPDQPKAPRRPKGAPTDVQSRLIARRITAARLAALLTQAQAADRMPSINAATLGRIERCERPVSIPELVEIATALRAELADLVATGDICHACGQEIPK